MSKVLKTVATVAAGVALVATGVGAFAGGLAIAGASIGSIGTVAGFLATAASIGAQITAPTPVAQGSVTQVVIDSEPPRPYMVGESYSAGVLRYQTAYGETLKKVPNPFLWKVKVFSGVGPVEALVSEQFNFGSIGSYYTGFYASDTQLGARPESTALVPPLDAPATGWGANHKISGCAAIGSNYKFDKDAEVFASGLPLHGAIWKGEKCYDPRLDSTYPGGSGLHRIDDETTWQYSANPALHAGTYAYGRYQNGIKVFGLGLSADGIDWPAIVDWANDCETNSWECHGTLWEGGKGANLQSQRVANLDNLCAAGGGRWLVAGALLSFDWHRPRVSLATLTDDDLLEEGGSATAVQSIRDRMNGVRPQYISPAHNWDQITADEIIGTTYRTEDGQPNTQTWPLNLVKLSAQAGELASYALVDSREIGPIEINVKSEWRFYKPGETITIDSEILGFTGPAVILQRDFDPATLKVTMTLKSETPAKHDFALGKVATPPPTPVIGQTDEQRDVVVARALEPSGYIQSLIRSVSFRDPRDASDVSRKLLQASEASSVVTISIAKFDADYIGADSDVTFDVEDITTLNDGTTPIDFETLYYPYLDYNPLAPSSPPVYGLETNVLDAANSATNPLRHPLGSVTTPADGSGVTNDGTNSGTGGGGGFSPDATTD